MRLSNATLNALPATVVTPRYARNAISCGMVHLGAGAFHRAHQAVYIDDLLASQANWAITAASLRAAHTASALQPQDGLYTLLEQRQQGPLQRVIGSVLQVLCAPQQPQALMASLTDPQVKIVSLTITEKGYCHLPASGQLDVQQADIVADLAAMHRQAYPRSALGWLVASLHQRRINGTDPFTVLSCDNLPANGRLTRTVVEQFAALYDPQTAAWIEQHVSFPATMVDRIVPATTDQDRQSLRNATGFEDAWPVVAEEFSQWVIEDNFCAGRPAFERVGVQLVDDVEPFELMKLRMLNGSHSTLAYLGYLAGHETVADAMRGVGFRAFIEQMLTTEIIPTLDMPASVDLTAYRDALLNRFDNPALRHRTWQIAMDGSQKLPQRLLHSLADNLKHNRSTDKLILALAGWMRYVAASDETGAAIDVRDPLADTLKQATSSADSAEWVANLLAIERIFPAALARHSDFTDRLTSALALLRTQGAAATVAKYAQR